MRIGVSFALQQGQLLAGEISRSAFLERASPLGTGTSEAAAVGDKVLAIAAIHAARLKSSYDHIAERSLHSTREQEIRNRAYEIYLQRGAQPGYELEDWLQAERELTAIQSNSPSE